MHRLISVNSARDGKSPVDGPKTAPRRLRTPLKNDNNTHPHTSQLTLIRVKIDATQLNRWGDHIFYALSNVLLKTISYFSVLVIYYTKMYNKFNFNFLEGGGRETLFF